VGKFHVMRLRQVLAHKRPLNTLRECLANSQVERLVRLDFSGRQGADGSIREIQLPSRR
jgi:hypothetical protein